MQKRLRASGTVLTLDRRFAAYAAGAGALIAAGESAEASIVYSGPQDISLGANQTYNLDFTGDGNLDYTFDQTASPSGGSLTVVGNYCSDGVANSSTPGQPYTAGQDIGSATTFFDTDYSPVGGGTDPVTLATISDTGVGGGPFYGVSNEYLGVQFYPDGGSVADYGWIELSVSAGTDATEGPTATIEGWAYDNSSADILTGAIPEPTALATLAMGAAGVLSLRPRRKLAQIT